MLCFINFEYLADYFLSCFGLEEVGWSILGFLFFLFVKHVYQNGWTMRNFSVKAEFDPSDPIATLCSVMLSDWVWELCPEDSILFVFQTKQVQKEYSGLIQELATKYNFVILQQVGTGKGHFKALFDCVGRPFIIYAGNMNRAMIMNRIKHTAPSKAYGLAHISEFEAFLDEGNEIRFDCEEEEQKAEKAAHISQVSYRPMFPCDATMYDWLESFEPDDFILFVYSSEETKKAYHQIVSQLAKQQQFQPLEQVGTGEFEFKRLYSFSKNTPLIVYAGRQNLSLINNRVKNIDNSCQSALVHISVFQTLLSEKPEYSTAV